MRLPSIESNEFAPTHPGLSHDPVILSNMSKARKDYALNKNILLATGLFILLFFTGLAVYAGVAPDKAAFHEQNYRFFHQLVNDHKGQQVDVSRLDAYYRNGWYYYDVSYDAGAGGQRRVYCGQHSPRVECFDPAVLGASLSLEDKQLYNSYQLAVSDGTHRSYPPEEIQSYLDDFYK